MNKYERRMQFERLCELRTAYAARQDDDRGTGMTVDEAIEWVERLAADLCSSETAEQPKG